MGVNGGTTHFINTHHAGLAPFQRHVWATQVAVSPQKGRDTEIIYEAPSPPRVCGPNVGQALSKEKPWWICCNLF